MEHQGEIWVTVQGDLSTSEIKKQTTIMTEEEEERRRKDRGEREGEKKLPLFHLSRKIMSFSIRQTQFPILGFLLTKSGTFIQINV